MNEVVLVKVKDSRRTGVINGLLIILGGLSLQVSAGRLVLKNGDTVQGDLVKLEGEIVTWLSDSFGEISIDKSHIEQLSTSTLLKMDGHNDPCAVSGIANGELLFSCADESSGQVPILALEMVLPYEDHFSGAYTYKGKLSLAGTHTRGNKREEDWDVDTSTEFRRGDFRHMLAVEFESRASEGGPADEEFGVSYSVDWFFQERWFWFNDVAVGAQESKNIDERYALGSGFGYQFWETEQTALSIESGVSYVKELFDRSSDSSTAFSSKDDRAVWRWATDFRYLLPFSSNFQHKHELLYSLENNDDWEFGSNTGLSLPLGDGLFSELKMEYDYDNRPQQNERKADTKFSVGVGYVW